MPNSLFSDFYLSLLFNFKIELSLGLSCLMSSVFIIILIRVNVLAVPIYFKLFHYFTLPKISLKLLLIIRIIKTTCFDNTILIAELEGKVP